MKKGRVVILIGTKRAGKTTAALTLHNKYNWNYFEFDHFLDSLDLILDKDNRFDKYFTFLESTIDFAIDDASNYGINTVITVWDFKPVDLDKLKNRKKIDIYCLMPVHITKEILDDTLVKYSKSFDWTSTVSKDVLEKNKLLILRERDLFLRECPKYKIEIIDTSFDEKRMINIEIFVDKLNRK